MDRRTANAERLAEIRRRFIDHSEPLTAEELAEKETLIARQRARDEARRSGQTLQASMPLDEAA
jgi:hypothetical protein